MIKGIFDLISAGLGLGGKWLDNKAQREQNVHNEQMSVSGQFAAEFNYRGANRTWFDSLIDGINRMPRPFIVFGMIWLLSMSAWDPIWFAEIMTGLSLTPDWLAILFGQIILLFFGGRMLENWSMSKPPSVKQVKQVTDTIEMLRKLRAERDAQKDSPTAPTLPQSPLMPELAFEAEMADESKPLSNAAILEWNRRRQQGK